MNEQLKNHHDYRQHNWCVSLNDEENAAALERMGQSGLRKTAYARQCLTSAVVRSRLDRVDKKILDDLSHMRADIDRLVLICDKNGPDKAYRRILEIEDKFAKVYRYLMSKVNDSKI